MVHGGDLAKNQLDSFGYVRRDLAGALQEGELQRDLGVEQAPARGRTIENGERKRIDPDVGTAMQYQLQDDRERIAFDTEFSDRIAIAQPWSWSRI